MYSMLIKINMNFLCSLVCHSDSSPTEIESRDTRGRILRSIPNMLNILKTDF